MKKSLFAFMLIAGICQSASAGVKLAPKTASDFTAGLKNQSDGSLLMDKPNYYYSQDRLTVEPSKKYRLSGEFKLVGSEPIKVIFSASPFTEDDYRIAGLAVWVVPGTETELAADAKKGDSFIQVKDTSSWKVNPQLKSICLAVFYADKSGQQSDLPNFETSPLISKFEPQKGITKVELKSPLRKSYPKGTGIRLHMERCFFGITLPFFKPSGQWEKHELVIQPMPFLPLKSAPGQAMWPGSGKVGILVLPWPVKKPFPKGSGLLMRNLEISEISE
ncbi:MAG: hypothetical protein PHV59_01860 [Victivallales bacterium]|nr:hypothetical protein [Victivallales bacterium]